MSILLSLQAVGAQTAEQMPDLTAVTAPTEAEINVIDLAFKGGWIMVVLLLLSLMACYIFIQRLMVIRRAGKEDETFMNRIKDYIHEGKVDSALNLCRSTNTPSARMIEKGITRLGRPMNDVLVAIENVGNLEIAKLEKGFPLIATTAAGAPMLGFLGTVTGMVRAFFDMANAGTNVDVTLLSGGIYEALVTTVGGLVVGIITLFAYNYLVSQVDNVVNKMEARTMEFMDLLNEPAIINHNSKSYGFKTKNKSKRKLQHGFHDGRHIPAVDFLYGYLHRRDSERHQGDAPTGTKADCCQATDACHDRCESELLCRFR